MPVSYALQELPEELRKTLETARSEVQRACAGKTNEVRCNATRWLGPRLLHQTAPNRLVEDHIAEAMMRMFDLAEAIDLHQRNPDQRAVDQARSLAVAALDDLHRALLGARPSEAMTALGVHW